MSSLLHIRDVRKDEIHDLALLSARAFKGRPLSDALFPQHLQTDLNESHDFRVKRHMLKFDNKDLHYIVVVNEEDKPVGWALWQSPPTPGTSPEDAEATRAAAVLSPSQPAKGMDLAVMAEIEKGTAVLNQNVRDALGEDGFKNAWYLDAIAVDPAHQRRGIGRMLMQWGQERADQEHKNVRFLATEKGSKLYRALGYEEVGSLECCGGMEYAFIKRAT